MPIRHYVLILLNYPVANTIVANVTSIVKYCNKSLVDTYSKLRVEFIYKIWNGMFISTNSVASAAKLGVIK